MAAGTLVSRPVFPPRAAARAQEKTPVQRGPHRARVFARDGVERWASSPRCWAATPEIYFTKAIDNSRLVKVDDPARKREMMLFVVALAVLFLLVMVYAWQHFSAIEYGYRIESLKTQRDALMETNRALRLEEASLRSPERIDALARAMGLQSPQAGQVVRLESRGKEAGGPAIARSDLAAPAVSVISAVP
jgi:cell division protein FtsL